MYSPVHLQKHRGVNGQAEADIISDDSINAIRKLKLQDGKNLVLWGSISLAQSLMKENLIDEYHIQLCPVLTGGGRSLFSQEMNFSKLSLVEVRQYNTGVMFLNYQPIKSAT